MATGPIELTVSVRDVEPMKRILGECANVLEWWTKKKRIGTTNEHMLTADDDAVFGKLRDSIIKIQDV